MPQSSPDTATAYPAAAGAAAIPGRRPVPVAVQILSVLVYGGFAITAVVIALVQFWPAGVALALLLGWRGHFLPAAPREMAGTVRDAGFDLRPDLRPDAPSESGSGSASRPSGNATFDAYRTQMLRRLEDEQTAFEGFLTRLRDARDKGEFDRFLDDRAAAARTERASAPSLGAPASASPIAAPAT